MAAKRTPKNSKDKGPSNDVNPHATVLKLATVLVESASEYVSDEQRAALLRAIGLIMDSGVEEGLIKIASHKSGKDVSADMSLIRSALRSALTTIAWHGEEDGAQQAKWFMGKMAKLANEYKTRTKLTHREDILGALRSLGHARTLDHRDVYFPNYEAIARAVLRNQRARPEFEAQVAQLAEQLPRYISPFLTDKGYRPGVDLDTVAREACTAGGVELYNVFEAPAKMRERRLREKLGTQPAGRGRGARRT